MHDSVLLPVLMTSPYGVGTCRVNLTDAHKQVRLNGLARVQLWACQQAARGCMLGASASYAD